MIFAPDTCEFVKQNAVHSIRVCAKIFTNYDVVLVGAGLQGLATAPIFLQIEPDLKILIVDSNETVHSVWARRSCIHDL